MLPAQVCNGVAVVLIQNFVPHFTDSCPDCRNYFQSVIVWGSGSAALLGLVAIISLMPWLIGTRRHDATLTVTVTPPTPTPAMLRVNEDPTERTPLLSA